MSSIVIKCKVCGGNVDIQEGASLVVCQYCDSLLTLPRNRDEVIANRYDRANYYRQNNEFDKALMLYEDILSEDKTDAEAYWCLVLCKYGINYVESSEPGRRILTCNRTHGASIFTNSDYQTALHYADEQTRIVYEEEAGRIDRIQRGILEIAAQETPYDIFICHKENDENGCRTPDSVIAQDLYDKLTEEGFRVFFSRVTLEGKLGNAFEPHIFAALHSSKVMVLVGTKPEYMNAVWVKNEWSRYLALMAQNKSKVLIPVYRDMAASNLPQEVLHLQAQDLSKLGYMQDLMRGIKKALLLPNADDRITKDSATTQSLLERAFLYLEDGNFAKADELLERVLDSDFKCAKGYIGKLMIDLKLRKEDDLAKCRVVLKDYYHYQKAFQFADENYRTILHGYNQQSINGQELRRRERLYQEALRAKAQCQDEHQYQQAAQAFDAVAGYKDSSALAGECRMQAKAICRIKKQAADEAAMAETLAQIKAEQEKKERELQKLKQKLNQQAKYSRLMKKFKPVILVMVPLIVVLLVTFYAIIPASKYKNATELLERQEYQAAEDGFAALGNYRDSLDRQKEAKYQRAIALFESGQRAEAKACFSELGGYLDSNTWYQNQLYIQAQELLTQKQYEQAKELFLELGNYEDSAEKVQYIRYQQAQADLNTGNYLLAADEFFALKDYSDSPDKAQAAKYQQGLVYLEEKEYGRAMAVFNSIPTYEDSQPQAREAQYLYAFSLLEQKQYSEAATNFDLLLSYKDSENMSLEANYYDGEEKFTAGNYLDAASVFQKISGYKDSDTKYMESNYLCALEYNAQGQYEASYPIFYQLSQKGYSDSEEQYLNAKYLLAKNCLNKNKLEQAQQAFEGLGNYRDSEDMLYLAYYRYHLNNLTDDRTSYIWHQLQQRDPYHGNIEAVLECKYQIAMKYLKYQRIDLAEILFEELGDYSDSRDQPEAYFRQTRQNINVGGLLYWGSYEQDDNLENGPEAVAWKVLEIGDGKALLITDACPDKHIFDEGSKPTNWAKSSIREWLNSTFLNALLSAEDQTMILKTRVFNDYTNSHGINGGPDTEDALFFLSSREVTAYWPTEKERLSYSTPYERYSRTTTGWWLRDPAATRRATCFVGSDGELSLDKYGNHEYNRGVRPAVWVDLSSGFFSVANE